MKNTLILILILLSSLSVQAQIRAIDRSSGNSTQSGQGLELLVWMQQNKPEKILSRMAKDAKINKKELKKYCEEISAKDPFKDAYPGTFPVKDNNLWYERTYYSKSDSNIEYILQIYIQLVEEGNEMKIKGIQFRENNLIVPPVTEIERKYSSTLPPPPPPPLPKN